MPKSMIFVEWSRGTFEGKNYDSVRLSDGVETMKVKNLSGASDLLETLTRGQKVNCTFDIVPKKGDVASVVLKKIELIK